MVSRRANCFLIVPAAAVWLDKRDRTFYPTFWQQNLKKVAGKNGSSEFLLFREILCKGFTWPVKPPPSSRFVLNFLPRKRSQSRVFSPTLQPSSSFLKVINQILNNERCTGSSLTSGRESCSPVDRLDSSLMARWPFSTCWLSFINDLHARRFARIAWSVAETKGLSSEGSALIDAMHRYPALSSTDSLIFDWEERGPLWPSFRRYHRIGAHTKPAKKLENFSAAADRAPPSIPVEFCGGLETRSTLISGGSWRIQRGNRFAGEWIFPGASSRSSSLRIDSQRSDFSRAKGAEESSRRCRWVCLGG